jgi:hypothetical protein
MHIFFKDTTGLHTGIKGKRTHFSHVEMDLGRQGNECLNLILKYQSSKTINDRF